MGIPSGELRSEPDRGLRAVAYVRVMEIGIQSDQELQAATTDEERMAVQLQAQEQMTTAVEGIEGITVDDYNAILTASQSDPELAGQVQQAVDTVITQGN